MIELKKKFDFNNMGEEIYELIRRLFPICRSITGNGVRGTFRILQEYIPLEIMEYPSGMQCFDWTIPEEWNISSAFIKDEQGNTVIDLSENNLHVVGYSEPISGTFTLEELKPHLHTLPKQPDLIPYVTSYYKRRWGFCLSYNKFKTLKDERYYVEINSTLEPGNLTIAESYLPGKVEKEIFFSSYVCHPSMANDSLSGVVLATSLYRYLKERGNNYYSYRFIFVPETIGAIAYLSKNKERMFEKTYAGLVVTCVGDSGPFNYKSTRCGDYPLDSVVANILKFSQYSYNIRSFWPSGSDERQYSSPGFNLAVGSLMRSVYGEYSEYHTSADNLAFVIAEALEDSFHVYTKVIEGLEGNHIYDRTNPYCEPHLGKYGLYSTFGAMKAEEEEWVKEKKRILWILNYADGKHSLIDIAGKMDECVLDLIETARVLENHGLIKRC